jgi:hypothetical protein
LASSKIINNLKSTFAGNGTFAANKSTFIGNATFAGAESRANIEDNNFNLIASGEETKTSN